MTKNRIIKRPIAVIVSIVFFFAAAIVTWKIIEDGATTQRMISAIGFALAGVIWAFIHIRSGKTKISADQRSEIEGEC